MSFEELCEAIKIGINLVRLKWVGIVCKKDLCDFGLKILSDFAEVIVVAVKSAAGNVGALNKVGNVEIVDCFLLLNEFGEGGADFLAGALRSGISVWCIHEVNYSIFGRDFVS